MAKWRPPESQTQRARRLAVKKRPKTARQRAVEAALPPGPRISGPDFMVDWVAETLAPPVKDPNE